MWHSTRHSCGVCLSILFTYVIVYFISMIFLTYIFLFQAYLHCVCHHFDDRNFLHLLSYAPKSSIFCWIVDWKIVVIEINHGPNNENDNSSSKCSGEIDQCMSFYYCSTPKSFLFSFMFNLFNFFLRTFNRSVRLLLLILATVFIITTQ